MISKQKYRNFVRANEDGHASTQTATVPKHYISGSDAQRIYLDVLSQKTPRLVTSPQHIIPTRRKPTISSTIHSDHQLFLSAQNNQFEAIKVYLTKNPQKVNIIDEYGWSLLMIACQANAVNTVKVLLDFNIDRYIRDKSGNSANSLVLQSKNVEITNILLNHKNSCVQKRKIHQNVDSEVVSTNLETYECTSCKKIFKDKKEHLASTVHNMHLSISNKTKVWYKIPESNRGFQMLVKSGWERENGLGPEGLGKRYPIKAVMKKDRKGVGAAKIKNDCEQKTEAKSAKFSTAREREKAIERNFRREFYDF